MARLAPTAAAVREIAVAQFQLGALRRPPPVRIPSTLVNLSGILRAWSRA